MLKRILVLLFFIGISGCVLPDYFSSPTNLPSINTPLPGTEIVETLENTLEPDVVSSETPQPPMPATDLPNEPTQTPVELLTPTLSYGYSLQIGSPIAMVNFAHPEEACAWMGVGGQVFDLSGNPVSNLIVKLAGELSGEPVDLIALTGGALYLGHGGYEFKVSDHPTESSGTLSLKLYDNKGNPISDTIPITTYSSCDQNFVMVNFSQVIIIENGYQYFMPVIDREDLP